MNDLTLAVTFDPPRTTILFVLALVCIALVWWEPWGHRHDPAPAVLGDLDVGDRFIEYDEGPLLTVTEVTPSTTHPELVHVRYAEAHPVAHRPAMVGTWSGPVTAPVAGRFA